MNEQDLDELAKDRVLPAYREQYDALTRLFNGLAPSQWPTVTYLPGWDVQAVASHIMGTELMLLGDSPISAELDVWPAHVRNEIGARNERWVHTLRGDSPDDMRRRWRDIVERRSAAMNELSIEQWHAESWTPVGQATYSRFMRIRVYDCWLHEQDIRDAIGEPGHESGLAVDVALDEIATGLGYIVGKKAGAPEGSGVTIRLTDPIDREFHVLVDGRARVVDGLDAPTATLHLSAGTFARLTGGRGKVENLVEHVSIDGDVELGMRVARNMAFTI